MITGYQWSTHNVPWNPDHYKNVSWNTGAAAERARYNLRLKNKKRPGAQKLQASSAKLQASSTTKKT